MPVPQDPCPTHTTEQPQNKRPNDCNAICGVPRCWRAPSRLQWVCFIFCSSFLMELGQKTRTPSESTEREKLSHDNLLGRWVQGGIKAAPCWHPVLSCSGEDHRALSLRTQRRLSSSLCVYGYMQGREAAMEELLPNKVTKAVSVGAGARTKSPAKWSLIPQLILPAVDDWAEIKTRQHFFSPIKVTLIFKKIA